MSMTTKQTTLCQPYQSRLRFRVKDFDKIPPDAFGVYGLWFQQKCIYIGKAKEQPIPRRLEQHWKGSHNLLLAAWISSKGSNLLVAYSKIKDLDRIDNFEKHCIKRFQPLTNKMLKG